MYNASYRDSTMGSWKDLRVYCSVLYVVQLVHCGSSQTQMFAVGTLNNNYFIKLIFYHKNITVYCCRVSKLFHFS